MSFTYMKRLDRLLADCSGRNYRSTINIYEINFRSKNEMYLKQKKHHFNGQGGGKPSNNGQGG